MLSRGNYVKSRGKQEVAGNYLSIHRNTSRRDGTTGGGPQTTEEFSKLPDQ